MGDVVILHNGRRYTPQDLVEAHENLRRDLKASVALIADRKRCPTCNGTGEAVSLAKAHWWRGQKAARSGRRICKDCNGSGADLDDIGEINVRPCDSEPECA